MIRLVFTGGTISMRRDEAAGGNVPAHDGAALVRMAPGLRDVGPVTIDDWARQPACHMTQARHWELREHLREVLASPASEPLRGIVITHGTDTLEETAYLLDRTLDTDVPVVLTGAMRTASDDDWDGPRNLTDAARVAASPTSRGRGGLVVFAGEVFQGRQAVKVHTTAPKAFAVPHAAPLGQVAEGGVRFGAPARRPACLSPDDLQASIALVPMVVGDEGRMLDLARPHHDGVVIAAFGSGNLPPAAVPAIRRWLADGKPVVLASRCQYGQVTPVYAFEGGGATLVREGVLPAGPRTPSQARMELAIALSAGVRYAHGEAA